MDISKRLNHCVNIYAEDLQSKLINEPITILYVIVKRKHINLKKNFKKNR